MNQDFINKQKELLTEEKKKLEEMLSSFAKKDNELKGDWDTKHPNMGGGDSETGSDKLDTEADEVEQYENNLPVEHALETKLENVNKALSRISNNTYGVCKECKQEIEPERLEVNPSADLCSKCK